MKLIGYFFCFAVALLITELHAGQPAEDFDAVVEKILNSEWADSTTQTSVELLLNQYRTTEESLNTIYAETLAISAKQEIESILEKSNKYLLDAYKNALVCRRLLEISEHLFALKYRKLAETLPQKEIAEKQYKTIVQNFESLVTDNESKKMHPRAVDQVRMFVLPEMTKASENILKPGYGQVLSAEEIEKLNTIIADSVKEIVNLAELWGTDSYSKEHRRAAFRNALRTADKVRKLLRTRTDVEVKMHSEDFTTWFESQKNLSMTVNTMMRAANEKEKQLEFEKLEREEAKRRIEDSPLYQDMRALSKEQGADVLESLNDDPKDRTSKKTDITSNKKSLSALVSEPNMENMPAQATQTQKEALGSIEEQKSLPYLAMVSAIVITVLITLSLNRKIWKKQV